MNPEKAQKRRRTKQRLSDSPPRKRPRPEVSKFLDLTAIETDGSGEDDEEDIEDGKWHVPSGAQYGLSLPPRFLGR
jgi:hypothetical protein